MAVKKAPAGQNAHRAAKAAAPAATAMHSRTARGRRLPVGSVLLDSENQSFVWLDQDGKSIKRPVTLGGYTGNGVVISKGLTAGDEVIVKGMQKVSEGMAVESINK